jgi:maleylpyruvate isomerase
MLDERNAALARCDPDEPASVCRMTQPEGAASQLETLRSLVNGATHRLLGDTIAVSDEDWRAPSRLPGWSRGHVATHIARHADGIVRLTEWARTGERQDMYASAEQRESDIAAGAGRSGLELQIDLDTSAGRLDEAFDALHDTAWDSVVELRGGTKVPARLLPLTRLLEVVVHHVDLDIGYEIDQIETSTAEWLLEWCAFRLRDRDEFPRLDLTSDSGFTISVGNAGEPIALSGTSADLLGRVLSRVDGSAVRGDPGLQLPAF